MKMEFNKSGLYRKILQYAPIQIHFALNRIELIEHKINGQHSKNLQRNR